MQNAKIRCKVKLLKGNHKGLIVDVMLELDMIELGMEDISEKVLDYFPGGIGFPTDYFTVVGREITIFEDEN